MVDLAILLFHRNLYLEWSGVLGKLKINGSDLLGKLKIYCSELLHDALFIVGIATLLLQCSYMKTML
jgi:hypothetical protein